MDFEDSYAGRLRALVGDRLLKLPGACVLIEDERGRILLEQTRGRQDWRLVGGLAEERESMLQCAVREVWEETGLRVRGLTPYGYCDNPDFIGALPNGHVLHALTMLFHTTSFTGELCPNPEELIACRWFVRDALPEAIHPRARDFIAAFERFERTGEFQLI